MSDIALLMTGVLATGQPSSPPVLSEQPLLELDNSVEQSARGELSQLVPTAQMTPPEFMQPNGTMLAAPSANTTQANSSNQVSSIDIGENLHNKISSEIEIKNIYQESTDQVLDSATLRANIVRYSLQANFSRIEKQSDVKEKARNQSYINQQKPAFQIGKQPELTQKQNSPSNKSVTKFQKGSYPLMPTLEFGDSGITVRVLQRLLLSNGYAIQVDGTFGALTETAVKTFQYRRNLIVDGIVGQQTWHELTK